MSDGTALPSGDWRRLTGTLNRIREAECPSPAAVLWREAKRATVSDILEAVERLKA